MRVYIFCFILFIITGNAAAQPDQVVSNTKIGIVLSGGTARGFAHLGVLQALEDNGIVPSYVAGASMGAVLGSIYASGVSPVDIYTFARKQHYIRLLSPAFGGGGLIKAAFLEKMLNTLIPHNSFDSLQKKFFVSVSNLNLASNEIMTSGNLKKIVCASAAIPFVFEPIEINGIIYVDGGLLNNLPVDAFTQIPDSIYTIGVSVVSTPPRNQEQLKGLNAVYRSLSIVVLNTELENRKKCDFFIEVTEAENLGLMDFGRIDEFYEIGYRAASEYIKKTPAILQLSSLHKVEK